MHNLGPPHLVHLPRSGRRRSILDAVTIPVARFHSHIEGMSVIHASRTVPSGPLWRSRWAALGAAVAVAVGAGGVGLVRANVAQPATVVAIDPVRIVDTRIPVGLVGPLEADIPSF